MTSILWDQSGKRIYESGLDRGVLYLEENSAVPWNGLISVTERTVGNETSGIYFDGVKYADSASPGDFSASMKAYTYPDGFLQFDGVVEVNNGLFITNQPTARFGLSYRTKIADDINGNNLGYKIHVLYNLKATSTQKNYESTVNGDAIEFEWNLSAVPEAVDGYRPTAHLIFDSREMGALFLQDMERLLYGDEFNDARLPPLSTLVNFVNSWVIIRITDNLDGTWTATGPDEYLTMLDATTFKITQANAIYLDANTYVVSNTTY